MHLSINAAASSFSDISTRGAAGGANGGLTNLPTIFVQSPSPEVALSSFSDFNVRSAAINASSSRTPAYPPAFGQTNSVAGTSSTNTKTLPEFGHYSAQGVPAFPGVNVNPNVNAIITGTQSRTAGTWTWTRNNR